MKPKPMKGQRLYVLNVGNRARHVPEVLSPVIVEAVGRKYFTVRREGDLSWWVGTFRIEDWREKTEYTSNHAIYSSEQEWMDEKEERDLRNFMRETFSHGGKLNLETLRKIKQLIVTP